MLMPVLPLACLEPSQKQTRDRPSGGAFDSCRNVAGLIRKGSVPLRFLPYFFIFFSERVPSRPTVTLISIAPEAKLQSGR